jgi:predicted nucleic acid-binding protein
MYLLDTNVLSEVMKSAPSPAVTAWLEACASNDIATAAICHAEILYGIEKLPSGTRRTRLEQAAQALFEETFAGRILPFDERATSAYAELRTTREKAGRPITTEDAMIAAIARTNTLTVVSRDTGGFADCGVALINPWTTQP